MKDGQASLKYEYYVNFSQYALMPTAASTVIGILLILSSLESLAPYFGLNIDYVTFNIVKMVFAAITVIFSILILRVRQITEGVLLMLMGLSVMIFSIAELSFGYSELGIVILFFIAEFLACSIIFYVRKQYVYAVATMIFSIFAVFVNYTSNSEYNALFGLFVMMAGVTFLTFGLWSMISITSGKEYVRYISNKIFYSDAEYANVLISTAGILAFATLSFVLGYHAIIGKDTQFNLIKLMISILVLAFGVYAVNKGILTEGLMMLALSVTTLVSSIFGILGLEELTAFNLIMSFTFIPLAVCFAIEKDYLLLFTAVLLFLVLFMESFMNSTLALELAINVLKIISGYYAIGSWIYYDTGREILPRSLNRKNITMRKEV